VNGKDREQFREFMVSRWPELVRLGYALAGDRWLAEDLAQTALAGACSAWWRVRRADDPDAYVRKILINASNRRFRRRRPAEQARGLPPRPAARWPQPRRCWRPGTARQRERSRRRRPGPCP
jgi:DNA-directed RNA polymerase specialized sigma24 family protein